MEFLMAKFGKSSMIKLQTCHPKLQELFHDVIQYIDCSIICGHRGEAEQQAAFEMGTSRAQFGESKHNLVPSMAVDAVPYPLNWGDKDSFVYFAGIVLGIARAKGIKIKWGGDWNMNHNLKDQSLFDLPHFELME